MIAATDRQYRPVFLYKNMHLRIHKIKYSEANAFFKEGERNANDDAIARDDMPDLTIEGRLYIPSSRAARLAGLTRDHICRLARRSVLPGQIVAGTWFLDRERLRDYVAARS